MLFNNLKVTNIDFVTIAGQVIWIEDIGIVSIPFTGDNNIKLHNITLALRGNFNLISFGQFQEVGITYHNNPVTITLM